MSAARQGHTGSAADPPAASYRLRVPPFRAIGSRSTRRAGDGSSAAECSKTPRCCLPRHSEWVVRELEHDGMPAPSWGLQRPQAKSSDGRMPTSRRRRSYDHRLIALVRETGDTSIARERGAPSWRSRPRVGGSNSDTDEPDGAVAAERPSPRAERPRRRRPAPAPAPVGQDQP